MPTYEGLLVKQRSNDDALLLFVFSATAEQILAWATIERTVDVEGAAQRMRNDSHVRTIRAYLDASPENIIPTAVSIALQPETFSVESLGNVGDDARVQRIRLTISDPAEGNFPGTVIDGQHRLLALAGHPDQPRILACAILGADELERAMHFVVINNKAKRVPSNLVKAIMAELTPEHRLELRARLTRVGITLGNFAVALEVLNSDEHSPFRNLLDWDINRDGVRRIQPEALENSLRVILADLRTRQEIDVDEAVRLLCAMWTGVMRSWNIPDPVWNDENSKLIQKAGLVAVTEFLVERINMQVEDGFDPADIDAVGRFCRSIMSTIPSRFWIMEWNQRQLDTSAGRSLIRQSLSAIRAATASGADSPLEDAVLVSQV